VRWLALASGVLLCARALLRPDDSWDGLAYHLPYAGRLWDIVPRDSLELDDHLELLYLSYPKLIEWLQGLAWKLGGQVQAANWVALGSVFVFVELAHRRFELDRALTWLALVTVPIVQLHATACYVDLPANLAAASAVLGCFRVWTRNELDPWDVALAAGGAVVAANAKFQTAPIALLVLLTLALGVARMHRTRRRWLWAPALGLVLSSYPYVKNALRFGAPFFPMSVPSLFSEDPLSLAAYEGPKLMTRWPNALRWLVSLSGVGELDPSRGMWTVDATSVPGSPTHHMGGYFGPWALAQIVFLVWLGRRRGREGRAAWITMGLLTLVVCASPAAHQLRYYLYWLLVSIVLNLWLLRGSPFEKAYRWCLLASFLSVALVSNLRFLDPDARPRPLAFLVERSVPARVLARLEPGGRYCLVAPAYPVLLYASEVLGRPRYSVKSSIQGTTCGDRKVISLGGGSPQ